MGATATVRHVPVARARTTAERVRKSRLIDAHGRVVSSAGLRVGYDDEPQPRALVPRSLAHLKEPLRAAGCALYPATASAEHPGRTPGRPPRGQRPATGTRAGGHGGGSGDGHGPGPEDADNRLRDAAIRIGKDFGPHFRLYLENQRSQALRDAMTGPIDEQGVELLRATLQEMMESVYTTRERMQTDLDDLTPGL